MIKPGDLIDRYRIESPIGEGGMGRVYRARDERLDRAVALKVLVSAEDSAMSARLLREARAVARLDHPNIVNIFDVGEVEGSPYLAMELVRGRSLRELVGGSLPPEAKVRIMLQIARALASAHEAGIVHRDIKPENVIVRDDGRVKVLDFGIARLERVAADPSEPTQQNYATLTAEGIKVGTPAYMAPEQIRGGELDGRCDQFAWGVTAYELFVGRLPFAAPDAMALIAEILTAEPTPPPDSAGMPASFSQAVRRALRKLPERRFSSMLELIASLESAAEGMSSSPPGPSTPPGSLPPYSHGPVTPMRHSPVPSSGSRTPSSVPNSPRAFGFTRQYSTAEMTEVFGLALSSQRNRYAYDDVIEAGREIGLDEPALRQAMTSLVQRGVVPASDAERERALMQIKRSAAMFGVIAGFLFLLNLFSSSRAWWFQYPALVFAMITGVRAVRLYFPSGTDEKPKRLDQAMQQDASRMTAFLAERPRVRIDPALADPSLTRGPASGLAAGARADQQALEEAQASEAPPGRRASVQPDSPN